MSGGCRVLTLPAYSRLSSLGMSTGSPSCRSSLWMVHERAEGTGCQRLPRPCPPPPLPPGRPGPLTQRGALLGAQRTAGRGRLLLRFLLLFLLKAAVVVKCKIVLHSKALQQPTHGPALALGGQRGQLPPEVGVGEVCTLAGPPGGGDATCFPTALLFTLPTFLPFPRMALALRGDKAMDSAPFFRCWVGGPR